jgi:hypothetical protein
VSERRLTLDARHARLRLRSAEQRATLAQEFGAWEVRARTVDRWWQRLYPFRFVLAGAAGAAAVMGVYSRRRLAPWVRGASVVWGIARAVRARQLARRTSSEQ